MTARLLTLDEAAERIGVHPRTLRRRMAESVAAGIRPGWIRKGRVCSWIEAEINRWLDEMSAIEVHQWKERRAASAPRDVPPAIAALSHMAREIPIVDTPCGVYFLLYRGEVVYVGKSVNPGARVYRHATLRRKGRPFDRALFVPVTRSEVGKVEGAYIARLRPKYNKASGARWRATDSVFVRYPLPPLVGG